MNNRLILIALITTTLSCNNPGRENKPSESSTNPNDPAELKFSVLNAYPHDTTAYTEGFLVHDGQLFESTGHTDSYPSSRSMFGIDDLKSDKIQTKVEIDKSKYFGEGITFLKGKIYQLTLTPGIGFIYDAKTFKKIGSFNFNSEGWGMTTDGTYLIRSDGTSNLNYHEPDDFKLVKIVGVTDNYGPVNNLNELEYINGYIYANKYETNDILKIDPASGKVVAKANFDSLKKEVVNKYPGSEYMNGIAYDSVSKKIYITGKNWPSIYEIKFNN